MGEKKIYIHVDTCKKIFKKWKQMCPILENTQVLSNKLPCALWFFFE